MPSAMASASLMSFRRSTRTEMISSRRRDALREQKMDQAYGDWSREVRSRAYVEMREPPL